MLRRVRSTPSLNWCATGGMDSSTPRAVAPSVIPKYYRGMKTAISVPDELFASADSLAQEMRISRSELYATAVAEYVAKHRSADVTAKLNAVYADLPSGVDHALRRAQARSVAEEW